MQDVLANRQSEEAKACAPPTIQSVDELNDVAAGEFKITGMKMKDAEAGEVFWESTTWDLASSEEQRVEFPKRMLSCRAIGREIIFYSKKLMRDFSIRQVMSL